MKKRISLLVVFFMVLYIVPSVFIVSYGPSAILAQPNMTKEFLKSDYLDESPESIDGFIETLDDNVFYTPDGFYDDTPVTAFTGNGDWNDSLILDGLRWSVFVDAEYLLFNGRYAIEGFDYFIYGYGASGGGDLEVYDTMAQDMHLLEEITSGTEQWYNGSYWGTNYEPSIVWLSSDDNGAGAISLDYVELRFHYLPLYDYSVAEKFTNYGESFTNVSDWTQEIGTITTDGDKASIARPWTKRQNVSITGVSGAGTNYQVKLTVTYDSDMQTDFDDLRFTDNDGITLLDYWRESYTASTSAVFWVEVKDDLDTNQDIYMYYGNSAVSTTSNGAATFLFYEDWSTQTIDAGRWDVITGAGSLSYDDTDAQHGYILRIVGSGASLIYHIESKVESTAPTALMFRSSLESTTASNQRIRQGMGTYTSPLAIISSNDGVESFDVSDSDGNPDNQAMTDTYFDSYIKYEITRDGTNAKLYADGVLIETASCDPDSVAENMALLYARDTEHELYSDWVVGRKFLTVEPEVSSWGDEETTRSYVSFSSTDYFEYYYEFYVTSTTNTYNFQFYYGTSWVNITDSASTTGTISGIISDSNANAITRFGFLVSGGTFVIDYLRISPANEMGWQHDFSTTTGISSADGGTIAFDDDAITLTADGDGSTFLIVADTTTTATSISTAYYPFFGIDIDSGTGSWTLEQYDGSAYATLQSSTAISTGTEYFNMKALDTYVSWWRITLTADAVLVGDWAKAYSIANYTVTQTNCTVSDYLYVIGDELYSAIDTPTAYIQLANDPEMTLNGSVFNYWEMDCGVSDYVPEFRMYDGAWSDWSAGVTNGTCPSGNTTIINLKFEDSGYCSSITFIDIHHWRIVDSQTILFDLPEWHLVESVVILVWLEMVTLGLDMLLIFLGLIMIPLSVIYLVKGGRNEASMDKLFYGLIVFIFGWALFLGGIL